MTHLNKEGLIDLSRAKAAFRVFLSKYDRNEDRGFDIKAIHTYHVAAFARAIAEAEGLDKTDTELAELTALLHDIGRFEELKIRKQFNSAAFDHAGCGAAMLKEGLIREFIKTDVYDDIIYDAIGVHSLYQIPDHLKGRSLLHAKILRDADKLDNIRAKADEPVSRMFGNLFNDDSDMEQSLISEPVMAALRQKKCVDIKDRKTPLDYYVTCIGFYFGLNFESSKQMVHENHWIETMVSRFDWGNEDVRKQMCELLALTQSGT